jgi:hypothetical protein
MQLFVVPDCHVFVNRYLPALRSLIRKTVYFLTSISLWAKFVVYQYQVHTLPAKAGFFIFLWNFYEFESNPKI